MSEASLSLWEREERVLRILQHPARIDMNAKAALQAQQERMRMLVRSGALQPSHETLVPCAWHATVEGEPA